MPFNVEEAKKAGYSDDEIISYLTQTRKFDVGGARDAGYTSEEIIQHLLEPAQPTQVAIPKTQPTELDYSKFLGTPQAQQAVSRLKETTVENLPLAGSMLGGILAAPLNVGAPGVAEASGIAGGYLGGKWLQDLIRQEQITPEQVARDANTGLIIGMGGPVAGKILGSTSDFGWKALRSLWGRLTGTGEAALQRAVASGAETGLSQNPLKTATDFERGMRGQITGEEIVGNTKSALQTIKDNRAAAYQADLAAIKAGQQNISKQPIDQELSSLMQRYNVQVGPKGEIDVSRVAMGETGRNDIKKIIEQVNDWGSKPGDLNATGLDALKRQLDDFYSESSQAREFVAKLRTKVRDTIVDAVPEYDAMTKGYSEATTFIQDAERALSLKKSGIQGRITSDQILRKLITSMREDPILRRDLIQALSSQGGENLTDQMAGYMMSSLVPRGLTGAGVSMAGLAASLKFLNPKLVPLIAASSPRLSGEFLSVFGKFAGEMAGTKGMVGTAASYEANK